MVKQFRKSVTLDNNRIWISSDETTDVEGRYIANVFIETLEINKPGQIFLLASEILEKNQSSKHM